jgi:hypothetical protein
VNALVRSLRVEARRLAVDPALLGCAGGALLFAVAALLAMTAQPRDSMSASAFAATALVDVAFVSAAFGAIRTATRFANGLIARDALTNGARSAWTAAILAAGAGGGALGVLTLVLLAPVVILAAGVAVPGSLWLAAIWVGAGCGIWGGCIGSIARLPLAVPLIVAATLSPALLIADAAPQLSARSPLGSALAVAGHPLAPDPATVPWLALAWLALAVVASAASTGLRPLL